jgi:hypothetical protein
MGRCLVARKYPAIYALLSEPQLFPSYGNCCRGCEVLLRFIETSTCPGHLLYGHYLQGSGIGHVACMHAMSYNCVCGSCSPLQSIPRSVLWLHPEGCCYFTT